MRFCPWRMCPCSSELEEGKRRGGVRWEDMALRWRRVFHGSLFVCQRLLEPLRICECLMSVWQKEGKRERERERTKCLCFSKCPMTRPMHIVSSPPPPPPYFCSVLGSVLSLQMGSCCCSTSQNDMDPSCLLLLLVSRPEPPFFI